MAHKMRPNLLGSEKRDWWVGTSCRRRTVSSQRRGGSTSPHRRLRKSHSRLCCCPWYSIQSVLQEGAGHGMTGDNTKRSAMTINASQGTAVCWYAADLIFSLRARTDWSAHRERLHFFPFSFLKHFLSVCLWRNQRSFLSHSVFIAMRLQSTWPPI